MGKLKQELIYAPIISAPDWDTTIWDHVWCLRSCHWRCPRI